MATQTLHKYRIYFFTRDLTRMHKILLRNVVVTLAVIMESDHQRIRNSNHGFKPVTLTSRNVLTIHFFIECLTPRGVSPTIISNPSLLIFLTKFT
jgi:hypothetical protein